MIVNQLLQCRERSNHRCIVLAEHRGETEDSYQGWGRNSWKQRIRIRGSTEEERSNSLSSPLLLLHPLKLFSLFSVSSFLPFVPPFSPLLFLFSFSSFWSVTCLFPPSSFDRCTHQEIWGSHPRDCVCVCVQDLQQQCDKYLNPLSQWIPDTHTHPHTPRHTHAGLYSYSY